MHTVCVKNTSKVAKRGAKLKLCTKKRQAEGKRLVASIACDTPTVDVSSIQTYHVLFSDVCLKTGIFLEVELYPLADHNTV